MGMFWWVFGIAIVSPVLVSLFFSFLKRPNQELSPPYVPLPAARMELRELEVQGDYELGYGYGSSSTSSSSIPAAKKAKDSVFPGKAKSLTLSSSPPGV